MRTSRISFVVAVGAAVMAAATDTAWQSKDYRQWTDKDAQAVMTDSPWVKHVPFPAGDRPAMTVVEPGANGAAPPSASLGNPSNSTTGTNMTVAGNPGSAGPADASATHNVSNSPTPSGVPPSPGAPAVHPPVTIIWASAIPVRLAVLKIRSGANAPLDKDIENAEKPRDHYVVAVSGLPDPRDADVAPTELARNASLRLKGKQPQVAADSNYRRIGNADVYFFRFLKAPFPLADKDGEVEFRLKMGQIEIKKRFDLRSMQYSGQLAL